MLAKLALFLKSPSDNSVTVSIVGLGRLGSPMVACFAAKGHKVIGVDVNEEVVRQINDGVAPVFEPGLQEILQSNRKRIYATTDYSEAIEKSQITFIVVPTPTGEDGGFSLDHVKKAAKEIGDALVRKTGFHLIVLTSTVLPGACDQAIQPILERRSGKHCGVDFGFCYGPEFIALGSVVRDLLNPDFILIGESDQRSGKLLANLDQTICDNKPPVARMNIVSAELTKVAINSYVTLKISYANMLAEICEHLPGADVDVVTSALRLDSRIGEKYLKGAVGYGGPCFPRDNTAFAFAAGQLGVQATLAEATDVVNRHQTNRLAERVVSRLLEEGTVLILGLSYKPGTDVVEESQGLRLARSLLAKKIPVLLFDPVAMQNARKLLGPDAPPPLSLRECLERADVVIVTTPWKEFREIKPEHFSSSKGRPVLIDCWRIFDSASFGSVSDYVALGREIKSAEARAIK
jgi:UDPglucose 6-dehydrogenase